ncbi:6-bladed beta-propeller [Gracilimonas sp.]|uniref:6-bladed beta-propeller n=1 Tax=Gracilimonas sp. TaxID=1974203 RepID=UPI00287274EE|nr:6-bladed beta-propeller [Gracilimonas sp.]
MKLSAYLSLLILFFVTCTNKSGNKETIAAKKFSDYFSLVDSIEVNGTKDNPVFSVGSASYSQDLFYITETSSNKVHAYNENGEIVRSWGRSGRGPGEFLAIEWIEVIGDTVYTRNGEGAYDYKLFNLSGDLIDEIPIDAMAPFTNSYFLDENREWIVTTGISSCTNNLSETCNVVKQNLATDSVLTFAPSSEVEPNSIGVPYFSAYSNQLRQFFVIHVWGSNIYQYDTTGELINSFSINISPYTKPLNTDEIDRDNPQKMFEQLSNANATSFIQIAALKNKIVTQYLRRGAEFEDMTRYFVDIYEADGSLLAGGLDTNHEFIKYENGNFIFKSENSGEEYGGFTFYIYQPKF